MRIATKYLVKELCLSTSAVTSVLLPLFLGRQFITYAREVTYGKIAGALLKKLFLLQIPVLLMLLLPAGFFIGVVITYGRMYQERELLILAMGGMHQLKLLKYTLRVSLVVALIVATISLFFLPKIYGTYEQLISTTTQNPFSLMKPNQFINLPNQPYILYAKQASPDHREFYDIFATLKPTADNPLNRLTTIYAKRAYQKIDPRTNSIYIILVDGYRYVGQPGKSDYEVLKFAKHGIKLAAQRPSPPSCDSYDIGKLWSLRHKPQEAAELHWRLAAPLSVIILALLAVPISRIPLKRGRYHRLIPALLVYTLYLTLLIFGRTSLLSGLYDPSLGLWWVHLLALTLGVLGLFKQYSWEKAGY